jgi:hypothetical protein
MAPTATRWPQLDTESLDPRILDEMEPPESPDDDEDPDSALGDFGPAEDDDDE